MSDQFLYETFIPFITITIVALLSAEFIGRSKHIGGFYSFFMMLGIIPGIVGLFFSPSAKREPTKQNKIYLVLSLFLLISGIITFAENSNKITYIILFVIISLIVSAYYCFQLSKGSIINEEPKFYFDNSIERIIEHERKNIKNSISNLSNLKNKGIITEEEFKRKVEKLRNAKNEQDVKNSAEYKQLKNLYEIGVLTKGEFENKVQLIQNISNNKSSAQIEASDIRKVDESYSIMEGKITKYVLFYKGNNYIFFEKEEGNTIKISRKNNWIYFKNRAEFIDYIKQEG